MITNKIIDFIKENISKTKNDSKTRTILVNIIYSASIKVVIVGISFLSVPILLGYLDSAQYGVWLTILTFTSWFTLFDLGLGNGLKNKLIEFLTQENTNLARKHISTSYISMGVICFILCIIIYFVSPFVPWDKIFNIPGSLRSAVATTTTIVLIFTLVNMVFKLINNLLHAYQQSYKVDVINCLSQVVSFLALCWARFFLNPSLVVIALVFTLSQFAVLLIVNIYLYRSLFRNLIPSFKRYDHKVLKNVANSSGQFFLIQIAGVVMYMTDNFIIANLLGPDDVTKYNIVLKYFSILPMIWGLIVIPLWPMITRAYYSGDLIWLKKTMKNLFSLWLLSIITGVGILMFSGTFYRLWIGNKIQIPNSLNLCILIYTSVSIFATIMATFINGIGKIKIQAYLTVLLAILNVPLALFFCKTLKLGLIGIPFATAACLAISAVFAFIQYRKIVNSTAVGLWNE